MFPKRHGFGYSYLQCGYPIIPSATRTTVTDAPVARDRELGSWWLRVKASDYLERGNGTVGFYNKLRLYLRGQHVEDTDWSYAYLITAPRFFGYAFNPVSFWYIYNRENQLKKMILEVNNTFGERRMYLLDGSSSSSPARTFGSQRSPNPKGHGSEFSNSMESRFSDVWMKDFHVSPFNSRKGSYALKALNPFPHVAYDNPSIDNTVTLKSSKDHAKLVARLHSTGKALDPQKLGFFGTLHFISSWWWVGFVTSPRILREAFKLFFKRNLHVWLRPEVLTSSIGRLPTTSEIVLAKVFKDYLFHVVHGNEVSLSINLKTAIPGEPVEKIMTTYHHRWERNVKNLELRVLTPSFYSRLIHYTHLSEAVDRECIFTDEKNRTLWICSPQLLPLLLSDRGSEAQRLPILYRSYLDELRWKIMRKLRCPPSDPVYSVNPRSSSFHVDDIRARPYSDLDNFVRNFKGHLYAGEYRRTITKLFLAQRYCFGFSEIASFMDLALRVLLCYVSAAQLNHWSGAAAELRSLDCLKESMTQMTGASFLRIMRYSPLVWLSLFKTAALGFACHAYGLLKGYN
ncbi:hypothetical protein BKA66DRAFT_417271 [Pyrenochaeta sp. MPI-SDFR-AT-0127]|nr:hypothetical protein BKA66DRAFT_417271 [Pyrenochaeta sp. MPI-SDFR-AT-0127]